MRIVIDMQAVQRHYVQTGSGGHLLSLAQALANHGSQHEVLVALNSAAPDAALYIRYAFSGLLPAAKVRAWHAPLPPEMEEGGNRAMQVVGGVFQGFLAGLRPDVVFLPLPMDGAAHPLRLYLTDGPRLGFRMVVALGAASELRDVTATNDIPIFLKQVLTTQDRIVAMPPLSAEVLVQALERDVEVLGPEEDHAPAGAQSAAAVRLLRLIEQADGITASVAASSRPKLAYVSPVSPERSGIADYSAELLPELMAHYRIDVIIHDSAPQPIGLPAGCGVRHCEWFRSRAGSYDRVLYHFGNSPFHWHMFGLLEDIPGVVLLHDFFLGDSLRGMEESLHTPRAWTRALCESHGYPAVEERFRSPASTTRDYPANLPVIRRSLGVIVHSRHAVNLARRFYGPGLCHDWQVIPQLYAAPGSRGQEQARQRLGLSESDFVVCSFGLLGPTKLNEELLRAWLASGLSGDRQCVLVFVGEDSGARFDGQVRTLVAQVSARARIRITGWVDIETFHDYLASADVAVQLRRQSRGETSRAILDCLGHGVATIVNANGSIAELPGDTVWMLPDEFEVADLGSALSRLRASPQMRAEMAERGRRLVHEVHSPAGLALEFRCAIEKAYAFAGSPALPLARQLAPMLREYTGSGWLIELARAINSSIPEATDRSSLYVDVSVTCREDGKTGIQRVVRSLVWELLHSPPSAYRVEPVYLTNEGGRWHYRRACAWTFRSMGVEEGWAEDEPVVPSAGDVLLVADFTGDYAVQAERGGLYQDLRCQGVDIRFLIYDLLPLQIPECFPPEGFGFQEWLGAVTRAADGAICISRTVAETLQERTRSFVSSRQGAFRIDWFHLGADIRNSIPSTGRPSDAERRLASLRAAPSFLMVGTIEPRKGYMQAIEAFSLLWRQGVNVNLVVVGREGWKGLPEASRRTIPQIVRMLGQHTELGRRLVWLEDCSDAFLEEVYRASSCLIAASENEGFGLPLIEAAQHGLPLIARDIPVFREVAGEHAYYFKGRSPEDLADAVLHWLSSEPASSLGLPWLTWKQSAAMLLARLGLDAQMA